MQQMQGYVVLLVSCVMLMGPAFGSEIVDPYTPPDVGVRVTLGVPRLVMLGPAGELEWGPYQNPAIWQLRDGRLVVRVMSYQDIGYNPDVDWTYFYFVSSDRGASWSHVVPGEEEERRLVMESGARLPDGTQLYFDRRIVTLDEGQRQRIRLSGEATRKGMKFAGVLAGELPEELQWAPMYVRGPADEEWTQRRAYLPPGLRLPVIKVVDRDKLGLNATNDTVRALFEQLEQGDDSVPHVEQIDISYLFRFGQSVDVLPDGSWLRVVNYTDHDLPRVTGGYADDAPPGERPLAAVLRSVDQGKHWTVWREIPYGYQVIDVGDSVPQTVPPPNRGDRRRHWVYRAHMNVMPGGSWVVMTRCCRDPIHWTDHAVMFLTRSTDQGLTWSPLEAIRPYSVNPDGAVLANGVAVRKYGRPGHYLTFCVDGKGERWGNDVVPVGREREHDLDTCNNNGFVVTGPDRIVIVYSDFGYEDADGNVRKAIFTREVIASPAGSED